MFFHNDKRLVALFIGYDRDNKQRTTKVAVADLNPSSPHRSLVFNRVLDLTPPPPHQLSGESYTADGEFAFDQEENRLLYVSRAIDSPRNVWAVVIWYIDPYFYVPHVEVTGLSSERGQSVLVDGDLFMARAAHYWPDMARKYQDRGWLKESMAVISSRDTRLSYFGKFIQPPSDARWEYVHHATYYGDKAYLFSIKKTNLTPKVPMRGDPFWQSFKLELGLPASDSFTVLTLQSPSTKRCKVYFFALTSENVVSAVYIDLRKDGSVLSDVGKSLRGRGRINIRLPKQEDEVPVGPEQVSLSALEWNGKVLVLVRFKTSFRAVMGNILDDGQLDDDYDWKHLPVSFGPETEMGGGHLEERFGGATILDASFVG